MSEREQVALVKRGTRFEVGDKTLTVKSIHKTHVEFESGEEVSLAEVERAIFGHEQTN